MRARRIGAVKLLIPLVVLAAGCCQKPWRTFDMPSPPDAQCRVGAATHGYDLYIWDCLDGEKVVIGYYSAEMSCQNAELQTAACGETTAWEDEYADQLGDACEAPPASLTWE